jgi:hypothetical protein
MYMFLKILRVRSSGDSRVDVRDATNSKEMIRLFGEAPLTSSPPPRAGLSDCNPIRDLISSRSSLKNGWKSR